MAPASYSSKAAVAALTVIALLAVANAGAMELTSENFDSIVADSGKSAFVKFFAPWCGHCKSLAPDWAKLGDKFSDSDHVVIGSVDCTSDGGKDLCAKFGVRGYPSLKAFAGGPPEDYQGPRSLDDLSKYVEANLGPQCTPANRDPCTAEQGAELDSMLQLSAAELDGEVAAVEKRVAEAEAALKATVEGLQANYEKAVSEKDNAVAAATSKLRLLRAVRKEVSA